MAMRVTGMMSGMDTESIIQQLVAARRTKVDDLKKKQTKLNWKQEAWKDLNTKIYKLYNGTLNNLQYTSSFVKKTTTVSNSNLVSVITKDTAMDSVQNLKINHLAKAGYLTGGAVKGADGSELSASSNVTQSLGIAAGSRFEVSTNGKKTEITIDSDTTINSLVNQLKAAGVNANFDAGQQRFYIGASELGEKADFTLTASNPDGTDALKKLGILTYDEKTLKAYKDIAQMSAADIADLKKSRVDAKVAAFIAERDRIDEDKEELAEKMKDCAEAYSQEYGEGGTYDLTDNDNRNARKGVLEGIVADLDGKEDLSEDELVKLNHAKAELTYINGYENLQKDIDKKDERLGEIAVYVDDDGNPTSDLEDEISDEVDAKIKEADDIYKAYMNDDGTLKQAEIENALKGSASEGANKQVGESAEIELNGVKYFSESNTLEINGLTITCNGETAPNEVITLTTKQDTSGIYNMIKNFIKEYSALINEMDKLYNAEYAKGYEPLTDEEREAMSDSDVEKWETKIKDSILRRDGTLSTVAGAMKEIMMSGFEVNGKKMYLYDFGIETMGYFNAAENEKNAYHIYGDEDDEAFKNETNKLMAMISSDPDAVVGFFTQLSQKLYGKMFDLMKGSEFSSVYKVYDDKKMKEEYDGYTTKIAEAEKKLQAYEDKWYKKFSAMETAMAKMQSNASAVTALLGGS